MRQLDLGVPPLGERGGEELRGRELGGEDFFCLMLDGVAVSSDMTAVVALGIIP